MNEVVLNEFEKLSDVIAWPKSNTDYQSANESLAAYTNEYENFDEIFQILWISKNENAQFFAAIALKNLFAEHWQKIDTGKRVDLRKYCIEFLFERGPECK